MKGIGGAERRFIIEAEGVKGQSSEAPPCRVFTRCVLILRLRNEWQHISQSLESAFK